MVGGIGTAAQAASAALQQQAPASTASGTGVPFSNLFASIANDVSATDRQAHAAVSGLLNGSGVELHDAMIATQKADLQFELALEMRNKAVAAYQQMMSTQF